MWWPAGGRRAGRLVQQQSLQPSGRSYRQLRSNSFLPVNHWQHQHQHQQQQGQQHQQGQKQQRQKQQQGQALLLTA
jgi:hypothetical protein